MRTAAGRDPAAGSNNRTIRGTIKAVFQAAKAAITRRDPDAPKPAARKRRGGSDSSAPLCVTPRQPQHGGKAAARGQYAALWRAEEDDRKAGEIADDFAAAAAVFCKSLASGCVELLTRMFESLGEAFSGAPDADGLFRISLVNQWGADDEGGDFEMEEFVAPDSGANLISLGL